MPDLSVVGFKEIVVPMLCYNCESDTQFGKRRYMHIISPLAWAERRDTLVWWCIHCKKQKVERVRTGDGGRYWFEAKERGLYYPSAWVNKSA